MSQDRLKEIQAIDPVLLGRAMTAYFDVWNMTCPHCATWLHTGLIQLEGVLVVDTFWEKAIIVITYDPETLTVDDLLKMVRKVGKETRRLYGAELIGHLCTAKAFYLAD